MNKDVSHRKKIDVYEFFVTTIRLFIMACGITLLLCFFDKKAEDYTKQLVIDIVSVIFLAECILCIFCKVCRHVSAWSANGTATWQDTAMETLGKESIQNDTEHNRIIAIHEAGHAVMAYLQKTKLFDIDITKHYTRTAYNLMDEAECKQVIMVKYAGAIAEELLLGNFSSGCFGIITADFESATELIKGLIVMTDKTVSKTMIEEEIGQKIIALSKELYAETLKKIEPHKDMIQCLADNLLTKKVMSTEEVCELLDPLMKKARIKSI